MRRALNLLITLSALAVSGLTAQEPEADRVHRVVEGETLSSIARSYFGEVGSWRAIYEANREQIADPHWIEPGQELRIPGAAGTIRSVSVTTTSRQGTTTTVRTIPQERAVPRTAFWTGPSIQPNTQDAPLLADADEVALLRPTVPVDAFHAAGWLLEVDEVPESVGVIQTFSVASGVRSRRNTAVPFDLLHLGIRDGEMVRPGDRLLAYRVVRELKDIGSVAIPTGMIEVVDHEELGVVGEVAEAYDAIQLGDFVRHASPFPLEPGVMADDVMDGMDARIITFQRMHELQLLNDVVILDKGAADGVAVGDEFRAYAVPDDGWEPEPIGRLQVVGVREGSASARILTINTPAFAEGIALKMSRKMR